MTEPRATSISGTDPTPTSASNAGRRRILGWGLTLVGVALCVVLAWSAPGSLLEAFERIRLGPAALAVGLMVATRVVDAWLLVHLFSERRGAIGFRPALRIVVLQNLSAFAAPKSGLVAAAALLRIEHGVGLARSTGIQIAALAIKTVVTSVIGLGAALYLRSTDAGTASTTALDAVVVAFASLPPLVALGYLIASRTPLSGTGRVRTALADAWIGVADLSRDRGRLLRILALSIVTAALKIVGFMVVVHGVVGELESPLGVVVVSTAAELGTALSFTPAGLGVREATAGATATLAGLAAPVMIGIALVDRALTLVATGILSPAILMAGTASTRRGSR